MVGYGMADLHHTNKWSHQVYKYGSSSSSQQSGDASQTERSMAQPASVVKPAPVSSRDACDSDSEDDLRRTPSPVTGGEESGTDLVQSPPVDGLTRPKCASSPVLSK